MNNYRFNRHSHTPTGYRHYCVFIYTQMTVDGREQMTVNVGYLTVKMTVK